MHGVETGRGGRDLVLEPGNAQLRILAGIHQQRPRVLCGDVDLGPGAPEGSHAAVESGVLLAENGGHRVEAIRGRRHRRGGGKARWVDVEPVGGDAVALGFGD